MFLFCNIIWYYRKIDRYELVQKLIIITEKPGELNGKLWYDFTAAKFETDIFNTYTPSHLKVPKTFEISLQILL